MEVIDFLKANGDKTYKGIEEMYKNLGESVLLLQHFYF